MTERNNKALKTLYRLPFIGKFIKFMNAYAYKGDGAYIKSWAPRSLWAKRVWPSHRNSLIGSFVISIVAIYTEPEGFDPGEYILGAVPDLLGFAIGIFALIFVLPASFKDYIDKSPVEISSKELPVNIAYPLFALVMCLLFTFVSELFEDSNILIIFIETYLVLYAIEMIIDLISFISTLARASTIKINSNDNDAPD